MNTRSFIPIAALIILAAVVSGVVVVRRGNDNRNSGPDGATASIDDDVLGHCEFDGIGAFNCSRIISTPHSETTNLASHVWLYDEVPSDLQKTAFVNLVNNYDQLWPGVAKELAALHPDLATIDEVTLHLRDRVAVHIGEYDEDSVELVYEFDLPGEGIRGFFLRIEDLQVIEAVIAE